MGLNVFVLASVLNNKVEIGVIFAGLWRFLTIDLVVPRAGVTPDAQEILAFANASLGKTQRLSRVLVRDDLPRSEIGKVLKKDLRAPDWP